MENLHCGLVGAPVQEGAGIPGCLMGPDAFRTAGIVETIGKLGHRVTDYGNTVPDLAGIDIGVHSARDETAAWASILQEAAYNASGSCDMPIFMGGDHSISFGTIPGVAKYSAQQGRPQFVLWLDAHPDIHTMKSSGSGNYHGMPVGYVLGLEGFGAPFPEDYQKVSPDNICIMGLRSVDEAERHVIQSLSLEVHDMRSIDEYGVKRPLMRFLEKVRAANGALHVSLDVDFLDPAIAPAVGTTVPGGATFREAHLIMELLCDSGLVSSLDLVELNPFLDIQGRTAILMVDLCASLLGSKILDRPTRLFR